MMPAAARVLVIDDEPQIRRALRVSLVAQGFEVESAADGQSGIDAAIMHPPDVVILDLMLPDTDGLAVCRRLREWTEVPIIVLSARGAEREKVRALDGGADDYLTKPFGMDELLARIRAALRRGALGRPEENAVIEAGGLEIDLARRLVRKHGQDIHLTPTEYEILRCLVGNRDRVVTHRQLLQTALGPEYVEATQNLRVFVAGLRKKLEDDPAQPRFLLTEAGVGYRFRTED
jgi:two-component system, OmpR family, KDP operon response regulator KdpE